MRVRFRSRLFILYFCNFLRLNIMEFERIKEIANTFEWLLSCFCFLCALPFPYSWIRALAFSSWRIEIVHEIDMGDTGSERKADRKRDTSARCHGKRRRGGLDGLRRVLRPLAAAAYAHRILLPQYVGPHSEACHPARRLFTYASPFMLQVRWRCQWCRRRDDPPSPPFLCPCRCPSDMWSIRLWTSRDSCDTYSSVPSDPMGPTKDRWMSSASGTRAFCFSFWGLFWGCFGSAWVLLDTFYLWLWFLTLV